MPVVFCENINRKIPAERGENLLDVLQREGVEVYRWPRGYKLPFISNWFDASYVDVIQGMDNLSDRSGRERKRLKYKPPGYRLASQCHIHGDVTIVTQPTDEIPEEYW
jgi:ferredoxin